MEIAPPSPASAVLLANVDLEKVTVAFLGHCTETAPPEVAARLPTKRHPLNETAADHTSAAAPKGEHTGTHRNKQVHTGTHRNTQEHTGTHRDTGTP